MPVVSAGIVPVVPTPKSRLICVQSAASMFGNNMIRSFPLPAVVVPIGRAVVPTLFALVKIQSLPSFAPEKLR